MSLRQKPNTGLGILYDELASKYMILREIQNSYPSAEELSKFTLGVRGTDDWKRIVNSLEKISELAYSLKVIFPLPHSLN